MSSATSPERLLRLLSAALLVGCAAEAATAPQPGTAGLRSGSELGGLAVQPAPAELRGRVAVPAGARLYSRPNYASPSWVLELPAPPDRSEDAPPRTRAMRVVGVVPDRSGQFGASAFVAVTNDLAGEDEAAPAGCGRPPRGLEHLRLLVYVPRAHLSAVTTRALELAPHGRAGSRERATLGPGVSVGAPSRVDALPNAPAETTWRVVDGDGLRMLAAVPDDALGLAWQPEAAPSFGDPGEALFRDPEGSVLWLRDVGGPAELITRNGCGEHRRELSDPAELETWRGLALEAFYEQRPPPEPEPVVEPNADYSLAAGTPLRWVDGELAGELLTGWSVSIGVGQSWNNLRCFNLPLGSELLAFEDPPMACVAPEALEALAGSATAGFGRSEELELGGSVEIGPAQVLAGGPYPAAALRQLFNAHHKSCAECLRSLLRDDAPATAQWQLRLEIGAGGQIEAAEVEALGATSPAVEDCLRAEAFTWRLPEVAGELRVPVTLGAWQPSEEDPDTLDPNGEVDREIGPEIDAGDEPPCDERPRDRDAAPPPERGKILILRDEAEEFEELEQTEAPEAGASTSEGGTSDGPGDGSGD